MSHTTGGIGQESGRIRFQDWIFIGLSGERTETVGRENRSIFSDLFGLVGDSLCESRLLRNVTSVFFLLFFFFPANGIALDGSETAMAPLLNDASRHRQRGLVIETDNRWTCFNSFDFELSITLLLFDDSKPTREEIFEGWPGRSWIELQFLRRFFSDPAYRIIPETGTKREERTETYSSN